MTHLKHSLIVLALLYATSGRAQLPPPPPPDGGVPPAHVLATVPELNAQQQAEIRKILTQRRDADEAIHQKARAEMDALHAKERAEHEHIDAQASDQLRKLLGDEGYRRFAQWQLMHHGGPGAAARRPPLPARAPLPGDDAPLPAQPGAGAARPAAEAEE